MSGMIRKRILCHPGLMSMNQNTRRSISKSNYVTELPPPPSPPHDDLMSGDSLGLASSLPRSAAIMQKRNQIELIRFWTLV